MTLRICQSRPLPYASFDELVGTRHEQKFLSDNIQWHGVAVQVSANFTKCRRILSRRILKAVDDQCYDKGGVSESFLKRERSNEM